MPLSAHDARLLDFTRNVTQRWGIDVPQEPQNAQKVIQVALKQAIAVAQKTPFHAIYPDDHIWTATGLRGLTVARLKEDDVPTRLDNSSEEWGVAALVSGFGAGFLIPLMLDVDEELAGALVEAVNASLEEFLDLSEVSQVLLKAGGGEAQDDDEITVRVVAASWSELRDIAYMSSLPLSEAVHFRRPVVWDILRAKLSGALCPPLPKFDEEGFYRRKDLSVRFDRLGASATLERITHAAAHTPDLHTPQGTNWFNLICDGLNSLGAGRPLSGISVIIHFVVETRANDGLSDDLPASLLGWESAGVRNLCIGYSLDPLQASYLLDLARTDYDAFHLLDLEEGKRFVPIGASAIPDMYLASMRATAAGRNPEAYDALVKATARSGPITGVAA